MRIGKRKAFKNAFSKAFECRNLMGFILFKSGFIMDQKGIKVFMKSLLQIYYITGENLGWGVCNITIFDSFDAFNPLT